MAKGLMAALGLPVGLEGKEARTDVLPVKKKRYVTCGVGDWYVYRMRGEARVCMKVWEAFHALNTEAVG